MKYMASFKERFQSYPVFTINDARVLLGSMGASKEYTYTLLHNLRKSREIVKITRGIYTFQKDLSVVGFAFRPFYYGLQDALSWRNAWEQETSPVIITPRKVRSGLRTFLGRNYLVRRIDRSMFFGLDTIKAGDSWIPVSDPEKTLIDFVYFKEHLPRNALEELLQMVSITVLEGYLDIVPDHVKNRVRLLASNSVTDQHGIQDHLDPATGL